ncbi:MULTISPECIES: sigma-E processing peptidase SpoIIGA [unclassified Paenibacillus]|uniref:sigma-E processing peptidase SpoIIGA n=1 Tax=unclassified Paenibacillus TaxID=185978 RepID=UPI0027899C16|nr:MULTISPECIES: sigma-E processing peptidase SpoIIGA [unclassified Paenibacillus]MDQ0900137.1 stage II sporulation protein GA (sporulation sigma-E factor processing peptidase) [Paenibacillus sp. V4I7]MDQ0921351.1 stage II sporulation protein GA (sporulation sigma-E factor processing peptidase) [Paenibacillus sp. V4I5]
MVVYADLIFLLNFLIDAAMLLVTAKTRKISFKWWRIVGSSVLGASYVVIMFLPVPLFLFTFSVKCMFCIGMIMTAFGFGSLQNLLRNIGTFLLVNFAVAGGMFGIHYVLASSSDVMKGIVFTQTGVAMFQLQVGGILFVLVLLLPLLWWFRTVFQSSKQREVLTSYLAEVTIHVGDYTASCKGLIDTGNQLYDPLTRTPVMVMEVSEWGDVLPVEWLQRIRSADVDQIISGLGVEEFVWQDRLRLVPYRGVNRNTQFMLAIKPDKVVITHNHLHIEASKVLIGLDGGKLCSDGTYQAIIHPALISAG